MAELGNGETPRSSYPGALDTNNALEIDSPDAAKTKVRANIPNDLAAALINIQTELGIDPAGSLADVKTFLQTEHGVTGVHNGITIDGTSAEVKAGTGTPESSVTAAVGSIYLRTDGGANTTLYVKESGAGNTGWIAK